MEQKIISYLKAEFEQEAATPNDRHGYSLSYPVLLGAFAERDPMQPKDAKLLMLAVYAWMPRVLTFLQHPDKWQNLCFTVAAARAATELQARLACINELDEKLISLSNNKTTGLSKFLHFASPKCFTVWDSHIRKNRQLFDSLETYKIYSRACLNFSAARNCSLREIEQRLFWRR